MDAVGDILAEKEEQAFPWAAGALLAAMLHLGIAAAFLASSLATPQRLAPPRAVAVRILQAGSLRGQTAKAAAPEPAKPKIEKPPEEAPPPPSQKAVLLPAKEEKKKKPTPAPPARATAPHGPEVSLPSSGEGQGTGPGVTAAGAGGTAGIGGAQFDQPNFKYDYYIQAIVIALSTNWFKPPGATNPIPPRVHFRINRDGTPVDAEIIRSSGLPFVDRAALRAVVASTFPPLPADWAGPYVGLTVTFE
ncbi:MAG TPA: TonB family protein [Thermoanaerobaculia bacterium]|nr:TonB family protein [Thermoanaerobaculia bacterium]